LYALVLAPAAWVLTAVGLNRDLTTRGQDRFAVEAFTGLLLLVLAGAAYGILVLGPFSPAGPLLAGLAYLGGTAWALLAPAAYAAIWPPAVVKEGFDLSRPGYGLAALLAVPLICTALSARRWEKYVPPVLPIIGQIGRARGAAAVPGTPIAAVQTTVISRPPSFPESTTTVLPRPQDTTTIVVSADTGPTVGELDKLVELLEHEATLAGPPHLEERTTTVVLSADESATVTVLADGEASTVHGEEPPTVSLDEPPTVDLPAPDEEATISLRAATGSPADPAPDEVTEAVSAESGEATEPVAAGSGSDEVAADSGSDEVAEAATSSASREAEAAADGVLPSEGGEETVDDQAAPSAGQVLVSADGGEPRTDDDETTGAVDAARDAGVDGPFGPEPDSPDGGETSAEDEPTVTLAAVSDGDATQVVRLPVGDGSERTQVVRFPLPDSGEKTQVVRLPVGDASERTQVVRLPVGDGVERAGLIQLPQPDGGDRTEVVRLPIGGAGPVGGDRTEVVRLPIGDDGGDRTEVVRLPIGGAGDRAEVTRLPVGDGAEVTRLPIGEAGERASVTRLPVGDARERADSGETTRVLQFPARGVDERPYREVGGDETQVIRLPERVVDDERTRVIRPGLVTPPEENTQPLTLPVPEGPTRAHGPVSIAGAESPNFAEDPTGRIVPPGRTGDDETTEVAKRAMTVMNLERPPEEPGEETTHVEVPAPRRPTDGDA
jgi:hypothetical protein